MIHIHNHNHTHAHTHTKRGIMVFVKRMELKEGWWTSHFDQIKYRKLFINCFRFGCNKFSRNLLDIYIINFLFVLGGKKICAIFLCDVIKIKQFKVKHCLWVYNKWKIINKLNLMNFELAAWTRKVTFLSIQKKTTTNDLTKMTHFLQVCYEYILVRLSQSE